MGIGVNGGEITFNIVEDYTLSMKGMMKKSGDLGGGEFGELLRNYLMSFPKMNFHPSLTITKNGFLSSESLKEGVWYLVYLLDGVEAEHRFSGKPFALYYMYDNVRMYETGFYLRMYGVKGMDSEIPIQVKFRRDSYFLQ